MSKDVTADFIAAADIKEFLGHRPLYISEPDRIQVVKQAAGKPDLLTIYGPDRLFWVNILELENENRFEAQLSTTPNPSAVLCYWLPWRKDGMVRIRLKVSSKYGTPLTGAHMQAQKSATDSSILPGRVTGAAITRAELDRSGGAEPRLFFTGMMDGCSTWIAGDPGQPVVYHLNRASLTVPALDNEDVFGSESKQHKLRTAQMKTDFRDLQRMEKPANTGKGTGVTPLDHKMHHVGVEQETWRKQMKSQTGVKGRLKVFRQYTSTFGVKPRDTWTFYAQDIFEYKNLDPGGNTTGVVLYTASQPKKQFP